MAKIQKKLGSMRYKIVCDLFKNAVNIQKAQGPLDSYKELISYLLSEYYDPMYDYQLEKNKDRIKKHVKIKNMYIRDGKLFVQT